MYKTTDNKELVGQKPQKALNHTVC